MVIHGVILTKNVMQLLQREPNAASRDAHRWALIKLIQAADRFPTSLFISVDTFYSQKIGEGAFADVYNGRIQVSGSGSDIAIKSVRGLNGPFSNIRLRKVRQVVYM